MRTNAYRATAAACALIVIGMPAILHAQGIKGEEILGLRIGAVAAPGNLNTAFGRGTEIELHFIEGLGSWFGVTFALSSHNFGESKDEAKNLAYTGDAFLKVDLQIYSATVGCITYASIGDRFSSTAEVGGGLYTINAVIPAGFYEGNITDNQYGFYGGLGLLYRLSKNLSLNLNGKYHYVFSGKGTEHAIYFYTGKERTSYFQIAVGVMILTD
jgi:hypothetical protein